MPRADRTSLVLSVFIGFLLICIDLHRLGAQLLAAPRKIIRQPGGAIKLAFRKLNSNLSERPVRAASGIQKTGASQRLAPVSGWSLCRSVNQQHLIVAEAAAAGRYRGV